MSVRKTSLLVFLVLVLASLACGLTQFLNPKATPRVSQDVPPATASLAAPQYIQSSSNLQSSPVNTSTAAAVQNTNNTILPEPQQGTSSPEPQPTPSDVPSVQVTQPVSQQKPPVETETPMSDSDNSTGFETGPTAGDPADIALDHIRQNKEKLGLTDDDLADIVVKDRYVSQNNGVTHIYFRQRAAGIEVFNGDININISRDGEVINLGNGFVSDLSNALNVRAPSITAIEAVNRAAQHLSVTISEPLVPRRSVGGPAQEVVLSNGGISLEDIPAKLIYLPQDNGQVWLVWDIVIRLNNGLNWWNIQVDANTGDVLAQNDWIAN